MFSCTFVLSALDTSMVCLIVLLFVYRHVCPAFGHRAWWRGRAEDNIGLQIKDSDYGTPVSLNTSSLKETSNAHRQLHFFSRRVALCCWSLVQPLIFNPLSDKNRVSPFSFKAPPPPTFSRLVPPLKHRVWLARRGGLYVLLVPSHVPEVIVLSVFVLSDIIRSHK